MEIRGLLLLLTVLVSVCLSMDIDKVGEVAVCPRKVHLLGGRVCKKACTKDSNCKGSRKKCVCDDVCGLTCLNPRGKCPTPSIFNGKTRITGKNKLGAVVRYSCNRGHELQGVETRMCNGDRQWSGVNPRCTPIRALRDPSELPQNIESDSIVKSLNQPADKQCPEPPSVPFADHDGPKQSHFAPDSLVSYTCRSGFVSEGVTIASCLPSGLWAGPMMTCREDSCPDLGELTNGVRYGDSLDVNAKVNYECSKGYRLIGSPTLTCKRGGQWDRGKPVCQMSASNSCDKPRAPRFGSKIGLRNTVGSVVSIVCNTGYKLRGNAKRICQPDGSWSGSQPECTPVDCGEPGPLWNGYIEGKKYIYNSVIKYRCHDGTKFVGVSLGATCLPNGMWSFPVPQCLRSCTRPSILNSNLYIDARLAPSVLEHGDNLTVACNKGLTVNDQIIPQCNNGTWSNLPVCVQGGCDQRPKEITNGMGVYRGTKFGDRVRYKCNAGHKLIGDVYLICKGGVWQGNVPECKEVFCPHPGELMNGKILLVGDIGKFEYRPYVRHAGQAEKIEYYCSTGYRMDGPSAATCIDGVWSPEERPLCIDNQHPMLPKTQDLFTT